VNIALPALVILLGLLPGIACFYGYFAGRFDKRTAGVSGVEELALYVVLAIPIDATARWLCQWFGIDLDFTVTEMVLSGSNSDIAVAQVSSSFRNNSQFSAIVYTCILIGAYAIGALARRTVWALRLDAWIPLLRVKHAWFYLLQGRQKRLPRGTISYVDVLTKHPEGSRLYRGLVADFEIATDGKIDSLTLRLARRGSGRGAEFVWKDIPSNTLTVMGSAIHSINVTYYHVDDRPTKRRDRLAHDLRVCLRSFLFEEP
jgi:hypothetical protein